MAESTTIIDEHFVQRNISIQAQFFEDDLLNTGGTREKFAAIIDRDNAKLFSNLENTRTMSADELLLAGLEAQESKWAGYVYHFTHLENAATILFDRMLKARARPAANYFKDSAAENVIKATRPNGKNYARFYFRPLTPTQRCNENLGSSNLIERYGNKLMCPVSIFFRFNLRALLAIKDLQWKVSLGNMASHHTEFDCTRDIVEKFDFQYVYADSRTERGKYSSQHEFLIESQLDFNQLTEKDITLIFQDVNARISLESIITRLDYSTIIDSQFFIGYNPRVLIEPSHLNSEKIVVFIDNGIQSDNDGKLFIQIVSNKASKTITETLIAVFQRNNILTILGKERISFVPETNNIQYAVYYKYRKQMWLIHINRADTIFKEPEKYHDGA